jgi:hypothetical protein
MYSSDSKEAPSWLQSTMKYFVKDFHDTVRSGRRFLFQSKKDVLGNVPTEYPKILHPFKMAPPYEGQLRV